MAQHHTLVGTRHATCSPRRGDGQSAGTGDLGRRADTQRWHLERAGFEAVAIWLRDLIAPAIAAVLTSPFDLGIATTIVRSALRFRSDTAA